MKKFLSNKEKQAKVYEYYSSLLDSGMTKEQARYACMERFGYASSGAIYSLVKRVEEERRELDGEQS